MPVEYVDPDLVLEPILRMNDFTSFGGAASSSPTVRTTAGWLEGSPHNSVHTWAGGAMLGSLRRGKAIVGYTAEAMAALRGYAWPGNVRELRNVVERAVILCRGDRVGIDNLPGGIARAADSVAPPEVGELVTLDALEEAHIRRVLAATKTLEDAAEMLGIDTATLWRRRKKYGI